MVTCDRFEAVPLIPMQLVMAAAQLRAREHLQMLKLLVIMQLQDQPLPQPPNTIHNVACAPFQAITLGDAWLLCSSSMHPSYTSLPQTLCFLLDRQRCRWPCELTARGGSPGCRCVRTFDGLWRSVCAGTGWSLAW